MGEEASLALFAGRLAMSLWTSHIVLLRDDIDTPSDPIKSVPDRYTFKPMSYGNYVRLLLPS